MDKLTQIRELLARLAELTTDELTDLRGLIAECFDDFDAEPTTAENVGILNELADAGEQVMARGAEIEAEQRQAEEMKEQARARRAKLNGSDEDEGAEGDADASAEEVTEDAPAPEAVAASGRTPSRMVSRMAASHRPADQESPEAGSSSATHLVASGRGYGKRSGDIIEGRYDLARTIATSLGRMKRDDRATGDVVIASAEWAYPEDRVLTDDLDRNAEMLDAVTHPSALVATGGICAPVNVDYSIGTWAVADRPLRDGLPAFQASRGGLTFRTPPTVAALAGATGIWTEATDVSPGGATKALQTISCPTPSTVYVDAVTTRLGFGNMMSQFDPETVAANTDLAIAAAARKAEVNLLTAIANASVKNVTTASVLGASRDFLATLDGATALYRNVHRLSDNQVLTIILPRWVKDLIRIDRVRELAHDSVGVDPAGVPDAWIEDIIRLRNLKPIWTLESLPQNGATYPTQDFANFSTGAAMPAFPTKLVMHIFVEGSVIFLDGGRLDLGVVRDSTLDATNDYETFVETFEAIANRGYTGSIVQFVSSLCANGTSSATLDVHTTCA